MKIFAKRKKKASPSEVDANDITTNSHSDPSANASNDLELDELFQKLNSKQRRLLTRRLEREGTGVLEDIRREVLSLLEQKKEEEKTAAQSASDNAEDEEKSVGNLKSPDGKKTKSKKRKHVDWSSLPVEERNRREEQRRLQKIASEQNEEEGFSLQQQPHRHPLNSERRRANRRKPKYAPRKTDLPTSETTHNFSGFHIRKRQKV